MGLAEVGLEAAQTGTVGVAGCRHSVAVKGGIIGKYLLFTGSSSEREPLPPQRNQTLHAPPAAGLQVLELGSNRIRAIEGLATLGALRELWLGRNRITEIAHLER